jgi:glycosyltransferase involved in cell wall biosynthesis
MSTKTKVVIFGTHPLQVNGYSKVVYELCKCLSKFDDLDITVWGFQNYYKINQHRVDFPTNIKVIDAWANEEPKAAGFGIDQIEAFVREEKPDICWVYNDSLVVTSCLAKIKASGVELKISVYMDQVTPFQKQEFVNVLNNTVDMVVAFTPYWETVIKEQGLTVRSDYLVHGINSDHNYPIPKDIARRYFNLNANDFIILNTNRNQPRKRWDICLKAFAEVVSRFPDSNIKLLVGTSVTGAWNLVEIYQRELKKRNVAMQIGMKHIIVLDNPHKLTDEEVNILHNVADIGINTCEGSGFELVQAEMGITGRPQVIPRIGGFLETFDDTCAYICDPILAYYIDSTRDAVGGEAMLCDYADFADGIINYYENPEALEKHGKAARERFLTKFRWVDIAQRFYDQIRTLVPKPVVIDAEKEIQTLKSEIDNIDISEIQSILGNKTSTPMQSTSVGGRRVRPRKTAKDPQAELLKLRNQIDHILSGIDEKK